MSWNKIPETDPRFSKWLKRENLVHDFNRVLWLNDTCGCAVVCLEGLAPKEDHECEYEDEREFRLVSAMKEEIQHTEDQKILKLLSEMT